MDGNGKIKIMLADNHQIMRDGLKLLLGSQTNMQVVADVSNATEAGRLNHIVNPDVITIGVNLTGTNGLNTIREFTQQFPQAKIIAHSAYLEKEFVSEMFRAGAIAYVHKEDDFSELLKAINAAICNEVYLCPRAANIVMNGYLKNLSDKNGHSNNSLTEREIQVLKLLANGKSSKQIALEIHVSFKTVDTHRRQIMSKLGLYSLPELTKYAIRCGLTSIE